MWTSGLLIAFQVMALPTSKLAWDWSVLAQTPIRFDVRYNASTPVPVGMPRVESLDVPGETQGYAVSLPTLSAGPNTADVRACWDVTGCGEWVSLAFTMEQPAPACTDIPSVFITRWEHTTGKPGSRMRVNFQPASVSPITEIEAKVNGAVVARITGTDLRDTAGVWFTTPASGAYKLTVWAKNAAGCTREVFSPVDLVVK